MIARRLRSPLCAALSLLLAGCGASIPTTRPAPEKPLSRTIAGPAGWIDVTDKALSPDIEYWLLTSDRSASLLLRELQAAGPIPSDESILTVAHISLRLKLAVPGTALRVTQTPARFDSNPAMAVYAYSEKGMLRRVLVFRKRSRLYELELVQENEADVFSTHLSAQIAFAMAVLRD